VLGQDVPGHGGHVAPGVGGAAGRDEGAAAGRGLDDQRQAREAGDDAVTDGKEERERTGAERELGQERSLLGDLREHRLLHDDAAAGEARGEEPRRLEPVPARPPSADHGDGGPAGHRLAASEEEGRRVGDLPQEGRVLLVEEGQEPGLGTLEAPDLVLQGRGIGPLSRRGAAASPAILNRS
jgi:hypothetical protein